MKKYIIILAFIFTACRTQDSVRMNKKIPNLKCTECPDANKTHQGKYGEK